VKSKVSTIIPAFNAERTIADAVDSALMQDFEGHEIIVVNDGSTDSTSTILERYGNKIRVESQENRGLSAARNTGLSRSSGEYVAFLDSDDVWLPGKLEIMIAALERNATASLAFSEYGLMDEDGIEYGRSAFGDPSAMLPLMKEQPFPFCFFNAAIIPSTWLARRRSLEQAGGFCEAFKGAQGYEDCWMLLLLRDLGEFLYVADKLTLYRVLSKPSFMVKYLPGVRTLAKLTKARYGRRGQKLIRRIKDHHSRELLSKIANQMDSGDLLGVLRSILCIAKLHPGYFLNSEFSRRLVLPQNLRSARTIGALLIRARTQA
jgi:glycosyltransferase involved in cell wall biosynthesis